jgi:putative nucleotidyltransferase with HDIG domain
MKLPMPENDLSLNPLPKQVEEICSAVGAPLCLIAHLILVHDTAVKLVNQLKIWLPDLRFDTDAVLFGAATHDIGKALHPVELIGPGSQHEVNGADLLTQHGVPADLARFTSSHATWKQEHSLTIEDLLVALADNCWRGGQNMELEDLIIEHIAIKTSKKTWEVFLTLDEILAQLSVDADKRLMWHKLFCRTLG